MQLSLVLALILILKLVLVHLNIKQLTVCPHKWREAACIACIHKLCTDNCSAQMIDHSYTPLILCMYPQGSLVMILMMIHVSHCPSLIISTWCGPLVLSFQVSPSPRANQHSICTIYPAGTLFIIVLLLTIGRKTSMAVTAAATAVCYGLLFLCLGK